jgi:hypothetical protein
MKLLRKYIPFSVATYGLIGLNSLVVIFHLLVLVQIIPFDVVWAGRLKTVEEMVVFEMISITINIVLLVILLVKSNYVKRGARDQWVNLALWAFALLFLLNTIGNLFSKTSLETYIATPLTFVSFLFCARLTLAKTSD